MQHLNGLQPERTNSEQKADFDTWYDEIMLLSEHPYFEGVWIVQEIAKGRHVEVWWGPEATEISRVFEGARYFMFGELDRPSAIDRFRTREMQSRIGVPRMLLAEAMLLTYGFKATDQRDKIHALLGMTLDGSDVLPWPSYTEDPDVVFRRVTEVMIAREGLTALILLARGHVALRDSPSWFPRWTTLASRIPGWITDEVTHDRETLSFKTTISGGCVTVSGIALTAFAEVSGGDGVSRAAAARRDHRYSKDSDLLKARDLEQARAEDVLAQVWDIIVGSGTWTNVAEEENTSMKAYATTKLLVDENPRLYLEGLGGTEGSVSDWVASVRSLHFRGRQMSLWASDHGTPPPPFDDPNHLIFEDWYKELCKGIEALSSLRVKLAVSMTDSLWLVHQDTTAEDLVFRLINCQLPVILRPTGKVFRFVGEVWAPTQQAGWINEYLKNAQWKDILIM